MQIAVFASFFDVLCPIPIALYLLCFQSFFVVRIGKGWAGEQKVGNEKKGVER